MKTTATMATTITNSTAGKCQFSVDWPVTQDTQVRLSSPKLFKKLIFKTAEAELFTSAMISNDRWLQLTAFVHILYACHKTT